MTHSSIAESSLTAGRVRDLLDYDPASGEFVWRVFMSPRARPGDKAGCSNWRYIVIRIDRRAYRAHRLAWLYMTGKWPEGTIDHRNLDKTDNRWANLREATVSQNNANKERGARNTSGFKGVYYNKARKRWCATIMADGQYRWLGSYADRDAAATAYASAAKELHGAFARID